MFLFVIKYRWYKYQYQTKWVHSNLGTSYEIPKDINHQLIRNGIKGYHALICIKIIIEKIQILFGKIDKIFFNFLYIQKIAINK